LDLLCHGTYNNDHDRNYPDERPHQREVGIQ
jgi:hypothetical protein